VARAPLNGSHGEDERGRGSARAEARERVEQAREQAREGVARARLSTRRLFGLDRSGPPPPQTLPGSPLNPWTIPNAIGYVRLALVPLFVALSVADGGRRGVSFGAAAAFFAAGWLDYADGFAARITGQYSRLGTMLDPVVDRLLVSAGVLVCWGYELLPRWAIAILLARELLMLVVGQRWVQRGLTLEINWPGRIAVGPTMGGIFFGLVAVRGLGEGLLYAGLALGLMATWQYFRSGLRQLRAGRVPAPAPVPVPPDEEQESQGSPSA
jgi:cardiolipin synthase